MTSQSILIVGAGGAVGRAMVGIMVDEGHRVTAVDRSRAQEEADERVQWLAGDATSPEFMEPAVKSAEARFGRLDALLHLAGTYRYAPLADTDMELWQLLINANLTSAYVAAHACLPALRSSRGTMIFVGAQAGVSAPANQSAYTASKAGLMAFARSLAAELRPDGIRVNCIMPDIIDTPANRQSMPKADTSRWLTVDQVGDVFLYLLSENASAVTGAAIALQHT